jgi:uncharacterized protein (TIGR03437 family)
MRALGLLLCSGISSVLLAQTPSIGEGGVINAASFARGQVITRGSLVSIFGTDLAAGLAQGSSIPLSTSMADVSVTFGGIPAPILFVSPTQINAQVPWELLGGADAGTAPVVVRRGTTNSQPQQVQVGPVSPGIFTVQSGVGPAIAINLDGSLAAAENSIQGVRTRPARTGDALIILATGLGAVDPPGRTANSSTDTLRRTTTTPVVLIGGREATVQFSGLAPEFVGVNQLNIIVPDGVQPGDAVPLQLRVGGITTSDRVIIAVRSN